MECAHHFSSRPDCNNTADVHSFNLRTALSAITLVSDLCGVDVQMIPGKIFTSFAKFQRIVSVNDFRLPSRLQELLQASLCLLRSFRFARVRLDKTTLAFRADVATIMRVMVSPVVCPRFRALHGNRIMSTPFQTIVKKNRNGEDSSPTCPPTP